MLLVPFPTATPNVNNPGSCPILKMRGITRRFPVQRRTTRGTGMPRTVLPLLFLLFAMVAAAQTAGDLTARYGDPDAEQFVVRPGITMMARYAEDRTACEMLIEPKHSIQRPDDKAQSMATGTVSEIIDELIPESERGILLNHGIESMGASEHLVAEYQNVTISRSFVRYLPANHDETSATVVRKDWLCRSAMAPEKYVPAIKLNATDLHSRYGDPDVQRFVVRPGITLMVAYDTDQAACRMVVEPTRSIIPRDEPAEYMLPEVVTDIIEETLPEADRGKPLRRVVTKSGCNEFETMDYENVTVTRFRHNCDLPKPEIEGATTVTRKNPACSNGGK